MKRFVIEKLLQLHFAQRIVLNCGATGFLVKLTDDLRDFVVDVFNFTQQFGCRNAQNTASKCGKLDQRVGGGNADRIVFSDFSDQSFNIQVGAFIFLCINEFF